MGSGKTENNENDSNSVVYFGENNVIQSHSDHENLKWLNMPLKKKYEKGMQNTAKFQNTIRKNWWEDWMNGKGQKLREEKWTQRKELYIGLEKSIDPDELCIRNKVIIRIQQMNSTWHTDLYSRISKSPKSTKSCCKLVKKIKKRKEKTKSKTKYLIKIKKTNTKLGSSK